MPLLFATSTQGVHAFTMQGTVTPVGLADKLVSQATARDGTLLAAVPIGHAVHKMMSYVDDESRTQQDAAGLYVFDLVGGLQASPEGRRVWQGNVKSCAIGKPRHSGKLRWYAGTEPADVLITEDAGSTWADTGSFRAISGRQDWCVLLLTHILSPLLRYPKHGIPFSLRHAYTAELTLGMVMTH